MMSLREHNQTDRIFTSSARWCHSSDETRHELDQKYLTVNAENYLQRLGLPHLELLYLTCDIGTAVCHA